MAAQRRGRIRIGLGISATLLALATLPASAVIVGGGGSKTSDCLGVVDATVNTPAGNPKHVRCVDGQVDGPMGCDADGVVNGVCEIPVIFCANSTALPECSLNGVQMITVAHALDNGDEKFDPEFQAMQSRITNTIMPPTNAADLCTSPTTFRVLIKGPIGNNSCSKRTKKIQVTTISQNFSGRIFTDKDTIKLTCEPADDTAGGCDPQILFTSTFDRIQRQIFDQSCAVSGCHDSQSQQFNLLLETGASLTNLINVDPTTPPAAALGWKRVTQINANNGDPDTSLLFHKIEGDFPGPGFGERMPRGRPKLNSTLREVIRLWILNGAPDMGWVPGTF